MKKTIFRRSWIFAILFFMCLANDIHRAGAQDAASIGTGAPPDPSAMLDVSAANKGMIVPWLGININDLNNPSPITTPANGLLGFHNFGLNTTAFYYWEGSWKKIAHDGNYWSMSGNAQINFNTQGIGTNDDVDLVFRRNNIRAGLLGATNTSFGNAALSNASLSGTYNTAFGSYALQQNTSGNYNTAFGAYSLQTNTVGSFNTALGKDALIFNTIGDSNTAVGKGAMYLNNSGSRNTAAGYQAMQNLSTGTKNTAIGYQASVSTGLNYAAAIGAYSNVTTSNSLVLGGTGPWAVRVAINSGVPDVDLEINEHDGDTAGIRLMHSGGVNYWRMAEVEDGSFNFYKNEVLKGHLSESTGEYIKGSDKRLKTDIQPLAQVLPKVLQLQPKTYHYIDNNQQAPLSYGFIAQEVETLFPAMVSTKNESGIKAINYEQVGVVAIEATLEQQKQIEDQSKRLADLQKRLTELEKKFSSNTK